MSLPPPIRARIHAMRNPADYAAPKASLATIHAWLAARGYHLSLAEIGPIIRAESARMQAHDHRVRVDSIPGLPPHLRAMLLAQSPIESFLFLLRHYPDFFLRPTSRQKEAAALAAQLAQARQTIAELSSTLSILAAKLQP